MAATVYTFCRQSVYTAAAVTVYTQRIPRVYTESGRPMAYDNKRPSVRAFRARLAEHTSGGKVVAFGKPWQAYGFLVPVPVVEGSRVRVDAAYRDRMVKALRAAIDAEIG